MESAASDITVIFITGVAAHALVSSIIHFNDVTFSIKLVCLQWNGTILAIGFRLVLSSVDDQQWPRLDDETGYITAHR